MTVSPTASIAARPRDVVPADDAADAAAQPDGAVRLHIVNAHCVGVWLHIVFAHLVHWVVAGLRIPFAHLVCWVIAGPFCDHANKRSCLAVSKHMRSMRSLARTCGKAGPAKELTARGRVKVARGERRG